MSRIHRAIRRAMRRYRLAADAREFVDRTMDMLKAWHRRRRYRRRRKSAR